MPKQAFYWQLYIASYTALLGVPFLFFPESVLPLIGFDPSMVDRAPFVRLTGMFLLCLTLITFRISQKRIEEMVLGTVIIRLRVSSALVFWEPYGHYGRWSSCTPCDGDPPVRPAQRR